MHCCCSILRATFKVMYKSFYNKVECYSCSSCIMTYNEDSYIISALNADVQISHCITINSC